MLVGDLDQTERDTLVGAAVLAPSMHNAQPWCFRFRGRSVEVHRDPSRELAAEDPEGRMTLIGAGTALLNLRVAAAAIGAHTTTLLFPDPDRPTLVALVSVGSPSEDAGQLAALFPFLPRRRTNRQPFTERAVPDEVRTDIGQAAAGEGVRLEWIDDRDRQRWLMELATDADIAEADDPRRLVERQVWVGGQRTSSGVPSSALGPRAEGSSPVRDLAVDPGDRLRPKGKFEDTPTLAVLSTTRDTPQDWVTAGQALQRVLLTATTHGVAASLLNQPIEHTDLRWLVRDPRSGWTEPQIVLRFGYGPEVPPTPRRPVAEFILAERDPDPAPPDPAGPGTPGQTTGQTPGQSVPEPRAPQDPEE
ncbi:Nitroreductase family protein [Actinopolymorpha cephalotaxi]|uniref:Nitroreductase family protein n=1 Tax=Actinopolymorpha cephalotaxi TaxID=504797 RepID=A0A1I2VG25_9ACTN|nr:hypothetical protein [Actinopolymorpha cephalotaxi]NYH83339.1 hypothetical protein [Actinopolymorpha cephalotaxi]SFG88275.1 Nitroreductase family protein [Actinopolymorpha cephalotaxi]